MDEVKKEEIEKKEVPKKVDEPKKATTLKPEVKRALIAGVVVIVVVGLLLMIGSSITGAATLDTEATATSIADSVEKKLDSLGLNVNVSAEMAACTERNSELMVSIRGTSDDLIACTTQKTVLLEEIRKLEEDKETSISSDVLNDVKDEVQDREEEIEDLEDELAEIKDKYDPIIANVAKKLCCVEKVYDNSINSYTVSDTNVHCVSNGEHSLSC
jgi:hypothetical protein